MIDPSSLRARFGDFARLAPISEACAGDRGLPIDRYYAEKWLASMGQHMRGRILEVVTDLSDSDGDGYIAPGAEVVRVAPDGPDLIARLGSMTDAGAGRFDCLVMPHVLQTAFDIGTAIRVAYDALTPGGALLATLPGITPLGVFGREYDAGCDRQCWSFTSKSAGRLFETYALSARLSISAQGNVLAAIALMQGLSAAELTTEELDAMDADYEVVIGVCVRKEV